jgi:membrane-bound lytic murein transglycosylase B
MDRPDDDRTPPDDTTPPDEPLPSPLVRSPIDPPGTDAAPATGTTDETVVQPSGVTRARTVVLATVITVVLLVAALAGWSLMPQQPSPPAVANGTTKATSATGASVAPAAPSPTLVAPSAPTRPADALGPWAGRISAAIGVPSVAVQAYAYAQLLVQGTHPQCHLGWTTLAGLGEVQSRHGQAGGAVLERTGRSTPSVIGPAWDGKEGRSLVADTDAGAYDGDADFDRGMGPLLLSPSAWRRHASDADNDQIQDPYDIDDASLAVAKLLCAGGQDMGQLTGWTAAVGQIQSGDGFSRDVFQAADSYGQRTRDVE